MDFKVGDRVRLVDPAWEENYGGVKTGDIVTITDIANGLIYTDEVGTVGREGKLYSKENPYSTEESFAVELVSEGQKKVQVGDKVRLVDPLWEKNYAGIKPGDVVEITEITSEGAIYTAEAGIVGLGGVLFSEEHPYSTAVPFAVELVSDEEDVTTDPAPDLQVGDAVRLTGSLWPSDLAGRIFVLDDERDEGSPGFWHGDTLWYVDPDPAGRWGGRKITSEEATEYVKSFQTHETPDYYVFPGGVEVRQISAHLTSFGGQALQYVARSTRLDGQNKGEAIKDLKKARDFIDWEIDRMEAEE